MSSKVLGPLDFEIFYGYWEALRCKENYLSFFLNKKPELFFFFFFSVPIQASKALTANITLYLSMLTGEDRFVPFEELVKRVCAGDANVLFPTLRSDGCETEYRRDAQFRLLCSMFYIGVFFQLDAEYSPLRVIMVKWKAFGASCGPDLQGVFAIKIRTLLQRRLASGGAQFSDSDVRFLLSDVAQPPVPVTFPLRSDAASTSLLGSFAMQLAASQEPLAFGAVMARFHRDLPETAMVMLTSLLMRQLMLTPFIETAQLEDLQRQLRSFLLWPKPFSVYAQRMLQKLSMEARSPAITWRRHWESHFPILQGRKPVGNELDVVFFCSSESAVGSLLESATIRVPSERELFVGMILNLLRVCGLEDEEDLVFEQIGVLSVKKLRGFYTKMQASLEQSLQVPVPADAMAFLLRRLEHLRRTARKYVTKSRSKGSNTSCDGYAALSMLLCGVPFRYQVNRVNFDCVLAGREVGTKWPRRNIQKPLREVVTEVLRRLSESMPPAETEAKQKRHPIRIVLEGGDNEFHHILSAYVSLLLSDAEILKKAKFRFYFVPTRRNSMLASYLSSVDPWYAKTCALNVRTAVALSPILSPSTGVTPVVIDCSENVCLTPPSLLHTMLNDFVASAKFKNLFKLFQCECWQKSSIAQDNPSKYVIPFALKAELGMTAEARSFQMLNDLPASLSVADISACKAFKFKQPALTIRIVAASARGISRAEPELEARLWQDLYFGIVPSATKDLCDTPRLSNSWMEMYAMPAGDPASVTAPAPQQKKKSRRLPDGSFKPFKYHVRSVEIEAANKGATFDICLDGVPYGPFQKVILSPCVFGDPNATDPQFVTIPVMSYQNVVE